MEKRRARWGIFFIFEMLRVKKEVKELAWTCGKRVIRLGMKKKKKKKKRR